MAKSQRRDGAAKVEVGACLHGLCSSKLKTEGWRGRHANKRLDDKHFHLNKSQTNDWACKGRERKIEEYRDEEGRCQGKREMAKRKEA
jgi:hypothetical protein